MIRAPWNLTPRTQNLLSPPALPRQLRRIDAETGEGAGPFVLVIGVEDQVRVCVGGQPGVATTRLLRLLAEAGARLRYHGDFDWPGVGITTRLLRRGARPWRMGERDYTEAVRGLPDDARLALSGTPVGTPWDERLSAAMRRHGVAVHEEALLPHLLEDLVQGVERPGVITSQHW